MLDDYGVSSINLMKPRGFFSSIRFKFRYEYEQTDELTAAHILNSYHNKTYLIFFTYGELKHNRNLVTNIYKFRHKEPLKTTFQLCDLIRKSYRLTTIIIYM